MTVASKMHQLSVGPVATQPEHPQANQMCSKPTKNYIHSLYNSCHKILLHNIITITANMVYSFAYKCAVGLRV